MLLPEADVSHSATASIQVWPAANRALLTPFVITDSIVELVFLRFAVGSVGGNLDVGIYDKNFVRLVHSGAAAYGANANKIVALSTTLPEGRYFAAAASDGVAIKVFQLDGASAFGSYYMSGFTEADSSYPLPATLSPTPLVAGAAWLCGLQFQ